MDWTSWSRTWSKKRTTTTSRKSLRWIPKILRSKRMYLLLRVDRSLQQNHVDVLLPPHLQKLYLSVKDLRLILSQKTIRLLLSKQKLSTLLRHDDLLREEDAAIEFWPPIVSKRCRKERKKMQVKRESQQSRNQWWIWSRDAAKGILTCLPQLLQTTRGKSDVKVKYLWARWISCSQEQWDL